MAFVFEEYSKGAPSTGNEDDELIVLINDGMHYGVRTAYTYLCDAGLQTYVNTYPVDTLPDTLEPSSLEFGGTVNLYVLKSTGIVYVDAGYGAMPVGLVIFGYDGYDKGYVSEVPERLNDGIFVMRKSDIFKDGNTIYLQPTEEELEYNEVTLTPLDWVKVQADFKNTTICCRLATIFEGTPVYIDNVLNPSMIYLERYCYGCICSPYNTPQSMCISISKCVAKIYSASLSTLE
jgi:hypothetical protein